MLQQRRDSLENSREWQQGQLQPLMMSNFARCDNVSSIVHLQSNTRRKENIIAMTIPKGYQGLRFPCECVSALNDGYSDPWAEITKRKLLPNGTKEEILNLVSDKPKTISQLAETLRIAPASVHTHINDLMKSELLRESVEWEKQYPTERYYEPNFPVFKTAECAEFMTLCEEMAEQVASLFERKRAKLERAFEATNLSDQDWEFSDVMQCFYANMQRHARALLEERGLLTPRQKHKNGARWIFWAQEPPPSGRK